MSGGWSAREWTPADEAALGVEDMRPWMEACEKRNRERGRITK